MRQISCLEDFQFSSCLVRIDAGVFWYTQPVAMETPKLMDKRQ